MRHTIKNVMPILFTGILIYGLTSCAGIENRTISNEDFIKKTVTLGNIKAIKGTSAIDITYYQTDDKPYAEIYAPKDIQENIELKQNGSELAIGYKKNTNLYGNSKCEVKVFSQNVTNFKTNSSADIYIPEPINSKEDISIETSSSGDIILNDINCNNISINTSSSGNVQSKNISCKNAYIYISSSGDGNVKGLKCKDIQIECNSSGDCKIDNLECSKRLSASSSSSGDIYLSGKCYEANLSANSSGNIYAKNMKSVNVTANASSSSDIECHAIKELKASCSSSGTISYKNTPQSLIIYEGKKNVRRF